MDKLKIGICVLKKINSINKLAYIVGGAVRDFCLNSPIKDVDITTNATITELKNLFEDVVELSYHAFRVTYLGLTIEVTSFRKDIEYIDHRHPKVSLVDTLEEDLIRRDFTINAMAMDADYKIIDVYNGQEDLKEKTVRCIGNPMVRFNEDCLRVLRAIELVARYNFKLDELILSALNTDYIKYLKEEYVVDMINKIFSYQNVMALTYIHKYQLFKSYPFYQVCNDECLKYKYFKPYILFYCLHNFIPNNLKLSKEIIMESKKVAYLVRNKFSNESLFYGDLKYLDEALICYNIIYSKQITKEDLIVKVDNLPIKSKQDVQIDFSQIAPNLRSKYLKLVIDKILNHNLMNENQAINNFLDNL